MSNLDGYAMLACAVIKQAIIDCVAWTTERKERFEILVSKDVFTKEEKSELSTLSRRRSNYYSAKYFIRESLDNHCKDLDLNPDYIRSQVKRLKESNISEKDLERVDIVKANRKNEVEE